MLRTSIISIFLILSFPSFAMLRMPHRIAPALKVGCMMRRNYSQKLPDKVCVNEECLRDEYSCKLSLLRSLDRLKKCRDQINRNCQFSGAGEAYLDEAKILISCEKNLREIKKIVHDDDFLGSSLDKKYKELQYYIKWAEGNARNERREEALKQLRERI